MPDMEIEEFQKCDKVSVNQFSQWETEDAIFDYSCIQCWLEVTAKKYMLLYLVYWYWLIEFNYLIHLYLQHDIRFFYATHKKSKSKNNKRRDTNIKIEILRMYRPLKSRFQSTLAMSVWQNCFTNITYRERVLFLPSIKRIT